MFRTTEHPPHQTINDLQARTVMLLDKPTSAESDPQREERLEAYPTQQLERALHRT